MLKLPGGLRIIERRGVAGELELLHHLLGAALFAFEQKRHVNLELDQLRRLVLVAPGRLAEQSFETLTRLDVILFLKWDLRQVVLRFAEFRIDLGCFLKGGFRQIVLLLLH